MKVCYMPVSSMECRTLDIEEAVKTMKKLEEAPLVVTQPIQYARTQRQLLAGMVEVWSEQGVLTDRVSLLVNTKTGVVSLEHRTEEIVSPIDGGADVVEAESADEKEESNAGSTRGAGAKQSGTH